MRRKFAVNLLFLFAANLLVKPFWIFGIERVVQNQVGPDVYGTYFAVFNYSFILSIVLDFGINNFTNRAVSRDSSRSGDYLLNLLAIKGFLAVIYFVLTFITAVSTGYNEQQMSMLVFLAINQILLSAILYFRSNIAALQYFKTDSFISILDRLLVVFFCLALLYLPQFNRSFNIMWFIYAQTLALLITAVVSFAVVARKSVFKLNIWKQKYTRLILMKSLPFASLALLMGVYYRIDGVMIERMLPNGAHEAGVYAASFRLLDAVNMFGYLFATLLLPMFANMIRKNEDLRQLVKFSSELIFVFAVIVAVNCYFFRNEVMLWLYPGSNEYWAQIFGWLMLNFIPMSSVYVFGTLLTAKGNLKVLNLIAIGGVVMNVGLNIYLIPHYGALGATVATLVTQFAAALAHIVAAGREFKLEKDIKVIARLALFSVLCVGILYLLHRAPMPWQLSFVAAGALCLVLAAAIKLVPVSEVLAMVRSKAT